MGAARERRLRLNHIEKSTMVTASHIRQSSSTRARLMCAKGEGLGLMDEQ
jgi:hypothetical protein